MNHYTTTEHWLADACAGRRGWWWELIFPEQMLPDERQAARVLLRPCGEHAQALLDELAGRLQMGGVRSSPVAYLRGLIARAGAGSFVPELGLRVAAARAQRQKEAALRREREAEERRLAAERATPEYQVGLARSARRSGRCSASSRRA